MADFNFTVQDLMDTTPAPFLRENTKDLPTGKALNTSGSVTQTGTFNPTVGSSLLSVGEMLQGPTVFSSQTQVTQNSINILTSLTASPDSPGTAVIGSVSSSSSSGSGSTTTTVGPIVSGNNIAKIQVVVQTAQNEIGEPYQWGGGNANGPTLGSNDGHGQLVGFDCSGLVLFCFNKAGLVLPRTAQEQYNATPAVPKTGNIAGDILFFGTSTSTIEHVGICIGNGNMIDAPQSGAFVRVENYNWSDFVAATRPFPTQS